MNQIAVKRLDHASDIALPRRMTPGSSGCDICAAVESDLVINPGSRALIPTGFCFEIPQGMEVQVRPRSGLAFKFGVTVLNTPELSMLITGEVKIIQF